MINKPYKKRIALVTDHYKIGGGLEHIFQIVWGMRDFKFGVFANGGQNHQRFEGLDNVEIFNDGYEMEKIRRFQPSIIHFHHLRPVFLCSVNPLHFNHTNKLYTAHGIHMHKFEFLEGFHHRLKYFLRKCLEKYVYHYIDAVIAVSEEDREYIKKNYRRNDCHLIPNGIDFKRINIQHLSKNQLREKFGLPPHQLLFLTVARFNFQKGYDILVRAIAKCREFLDKRSVRFLMVGEGEEQSGIKTLADQLGIADLICLLGLRTDVSDLMKTCDYFILPSRWEGHPITLIEASFLKLPIIASDTYGNREIVSHGETGILFRNTDSEALARRIIEVINKKFCREKLVKQAYQQVILNCRGDRMVSQLKDVYLSYLQANHL
jgi:glycosyltransferase involved in cell wall biosynthesis